MLTLEILELVLRFAIFGMGFIAMVGWKRDGDRLDKCREKNKRLEEENLQLHVYLRHLEYKIAKGNAKTLFEEVEK